jgi:hypothetical protein
MAKFVGHLYGGAAVSSVAAIAVYSLGWAGPEQTQLLFFLGVAGGLLPDVDADNSAPIRGVFTLIGVLLAFTASLALVGRFPVIELAMIWAGVFVLVRYGVFEVFARLTVHRGVWHSWLAAVLVAVAGANAGYHILGFTAFDSWLAGAFIALGYLTHLLLDEVASVDLLGNRVRRSFGTALKPFSVSHPWASLSMLLAVIALSIPAPSPGPLLAAGWETGPNARSLEAKLLGPGDWMGRLGAVFASGH